MTCVHLTGQYMFSCSASKEVYVPSTYELNEYCTSARSPICPFYHRDEGRQTATCAGPRPEPRLARNF